MRLSLQLPLALIAAAHGACALASEPAGAEGVHFVEMAKMTVPIVDSDQATGRLKIGLVLQATDAAAAVRIGATMATLRETTLTAAVEFARLYASPSMPVDARRLVDDLTRALRARDRGIVRVLLVTVSATSM